MPCVYISRRASPTEKDSRAVMMGVSLMPEPGFDHFEALGKSSQLLNK